MLHTKPALVRELPDGPKQKLDGPVFVETDRPNVKPGFREMLCEQAAIEERFQRRVVKLAFLDPLSGDRVLCYLNLNPRRKTKFYDAWTAANGQPPILRQVMSIRVFKGKFFEVEIGETTKAYDGTKLKAGQGYSVVKRILRKTQ